jgi:hypothetical protein
MGIAEPLVFDVHCRIVQLSKKAKHFVRCACYWLGEIPIFRKASATSRRRVVAGGSELSGGSATRRRLSPSTLADDQSHRI